MQYEFLVRLGRPEDLSEIAQLFHICFPQQAPRFSPEDSARKFIDLPKNHLVIQQGERLIGFIALASDGYMRHLLIHPDYRRKGFGEMLLSMMEARARRLDLETLYVESPDETVPFFKACGYSVMVARHQLEGSLPQKGVILKKDLY